VTLVGGDTTRGPRNLCLTIVGELPAGAAITRAGARAGDDIHVSGGWATRRSRSQRCSSAPDSPRTCWRRCSAASTRRNRAVALGEKLRGVASSAIDVSDGLTGDLAHVLDASGVGADVELDRIPRAPALAQKLAGEERDLALACLLAGGDDYELCFTAPPSVRARLAATAVELALPVTRIGTITANRDCAFVTKPAAHWPRCRRRSITSDERTCPLPRPAPARGSGCPKGG